MILVLAIITDDWWLSTIVDCNSFRAKLLSVAYNYVALFLSYLAASIPLILIAFLLLIIDYWKLIETSNSLTMTSDFFVKSDFIDYLIKNRPGKLRLKADRKSIEQVKVIKFIDCVWWCWSLSSPHQIYHESIVFIALIMIVIRSISNY